MVVNNAGIAPGGGGPLWQADPQDWQRVLAVNLLNVVHGIQAFVPHLVTAGAGRVVKYRLVGRASGDAVRGYLRRQQARGGRDLRDVARRAAGHGLPIGVTVACPGFVRTPLAEGLVALAQADDDVLTDQLLPADMSREQMELLWAQLKRGIATMMEPQVAAERILAAVEADRLYALTHGDFEDGVRHRAENILAALNDRGGSGNYVGTAGDK